MPGRYLFCVPWQDSTIIGTWYWRFPEFGDAVIDAHRIIDLDEVLQDINDSLEGVDVSDKDITRIHWGWLPGNWDHASDAEASLLRDPSILTQAPRLKSAPCVVVEGTKFTNANIVSLEVLNAIPSLGKREKYCGAPSIAPISPVLTGERLNVFENEARSLGLSADTINRLAKQYGNVAQDILDIARRQPELANPIDGEAATTQSEIVYCVLEEQALHLADVIFRRTGIGGRGLPAKETLECCAALMARYRGWNDDAVNEQIRRITEQPYNGRWIET